MLLAVIIAACCLALVALLIVVLPRLCRLQFPKTKAANVPAGSADRWGWWIAGLFGVAWSAGTIAMDVLFVRITTQQYHARDYLPTQGLVLKCDQVEKSSGDGTSYDVDIEYVYSVADQEFQGTRIRYYKLWGKSWVSEFVAAHPPQTRITVYYHPADPADAVLIRDLDGGPLWMAMFAVPFNVAMLGILAFFLMAFRQRKWPDLPSFLVIDSGAIRRIRLEPYGPAVAGLGGLFAATLVGGVSIACCGGMTPSFEVMAIAWVIALGLSVWGSVHSAYQSAAGAYDTVLDAQKETIALPRRIVEPAAVVPFSAVMSVDVIAVPGEEDTMQYAPTVRWRSQDGQLHEDRLATWYSEAHADQLAALLRTEMRLPAGRGDGEG